MHERTRKTLDKRISPNESVGLTIHRHREAPLPPELAVATHSDAKGKVLISH
jgi:hypothetical protein